jgi:hypothetical protein
MLEKELEIKGLASRRKRESSMAKELAENGLV